MKPPPQVIQARALESIGAGVQLLRDDIERGQAMALQSVNPYDGKLRTFFAALQRFDRNETLIPYGIFLLRMTLVAIWIAHFWYKVGYRGMPATEL